MGTPYIYWKIDKNNMVTFYMEQNGGDTKVIAMEDLENIIGDYAEQREDEWVEKGE